MSSKVTRVVILGTDHSSQLVAEWCRPAVVRAFFARVAPDALCIEHTPADHARGDFQYGHYMYERQYIALPWAEERSIPLYPIDWVPEAEDQMLVWGVPDLESPPFVRDAHSYCQFLKFERQTLDLDLFFADKEDVRLSVAEWYDQPRQQGEADFQRRLALYRTFLQAQRIRIAAEHSRGDTLLVVIGSLHKGDIENVLSHHSALQIVQPSSYGYPNGSEIHGAEHRADLFAILSFNLLGVQALTGEVNWAWMRRILDQLESEGATPETTLLQTRLEVLTDRITREEALTRFTNVWHQTDGKKHFTFDGMHRRDRIDSYYDPFGNLTVRQRALLEMARESHKLGRTTAATELRRLLRDDESFSSLQRGQLDAYWCEYVYHVQ